MRRLFALCFFAMACFAAAPNMYIAQNAAGGSNGSSCANSEPASFFNSPANWGSTSTQIGPGTTVHLCGIITSMISIQGSGVSGSPVTILFETGAAVQEPVCDANYGCMSIAGGQYIIVDGGSTCGWINGALVPCNGTIQSTLNGTPGAACPGGPCSQQAGSIGLVASNCSNCEIRNMNLANIYVHTSTSDTPNFNQYPSAVYWNNEGNSVSNVLFHNNIVHDCTWCVMDNYGNDSNFQFYNNDIYNSAHGVILAGYSAVAAKSIQIYRNYIHDYANWDTGSADYFHLAGIHAYGTANSNTTGTLVYDNVFGGPITSTNFTAHIYMENYNFASGVFNNILMTPPSGTASFGLIAVGGGSGGVGPSIYNNTILDDGNGICILVNNAAGPALITVENNLCSGAATGIYYYSSGTYTINNNIYAALTGKNNFYNGDYFSSLSAWRSATGQDAQSQMLPTADVEPNGELLSGSPVVGAAANLTSLGIPALNADFSLVARPSTGAWSVGAYQGGGGSPPPPPPPTTYTLTVVSGSGSGTYTAGTAVIITASAPPSGKVFKSWTGAAVANAAASTTALTMPAGNTTVTATYAAVVPPPPPPTKTYTLNVNGGSGSGKYAAGTVVTVTTQITMPAKNTTVTITTR